MSDEFIKLPDPPNATSMGVFSRIGAVVLAVLLTGVFAIASWWAIESFLDANANQCVGPVCIHGPVKPP